MDRLINRRQQGDLGEASAIEWLTRQGATVSVPMGHSPDYDLIAEVDGRLLRVQVKTCSRRETTKDGSERWPVLICTNGGNQSWSGLTKEFDPGKVDALFALVGNGRRWFIPAAAIEARRSLRLGGPKYAEFEVEASSSFLELVYGQAFLDSATPPGEYPRGQRMAAVNGPAMPSQVRLLPPPSASAQDPPPIKRSRYERKLGQRSQAVINQKRRITLPQGSIVRRGSSERRSSARSVRRFRPPGGRAG
jgi:hypothetical protein